MVKVTVIKPPQPPLPKVVVEMDLELAVILRTLLEFGVSSEVYIDRLGELSNALSKSGVTFNSRRFRQKVQIKGD